MSTLIFDKYEIIRRLAIGGMGEIFLARQKGVAGFDRLVIIKTLLPELAEDHGFVQQFLDEARVAATLNHPNVVGVHEVGSWQGTYFIVMEYIAGENLSRLLTVVTQAGAGVPAGLSARIVHDAALGLDHAHRATDVDGASLHVIHRDVSPQNIMVRSDGVTKVVDFGIAKAANRHVRTRTGILKGKLGYMSPEQVNDSTTDALSDQYSLGVVLWELCAGERLMSSSDEVATIKRITSERVPVLTTVIDGLPAGLAEVVARMTAPDRSERYANCADVAVALRDLAPPHEELGTFVSSYLGDSIRERIADLTPTQDDFLIPLRAQRADPELATVGGQDASGAASQVSAIAPPKPRSRGWPLAIALIAIVGLAGTLAWLQPWTKADVPVPANVTAVKAARLVVTSEPSAATVMLNNEALGKTPLRTDTVVADVMHRLRVVLEGYAPHERDLELKPGETRELGIVLSKVTAPKPKAKKKSRAKRSVDVAVAPAGPGYVSVDTKPWTHVSIDGEPVDVTPISKHRLDAGRHTVRLVNDKAGIDETQSIVVEPGKVHKVRLKNRTP